MPQVTALSKHKKNAQSLSNSTDVGSRGLNGHLFLICVRECFTCIWTIQPVCSVLKRIFAVRFCCNHNFFEAQQSVFFLSLLWLFYPKDHHTFSSFYSSTQCCHGYSKTLIHDIQDLCSSKSLLRVNGAMPLVYTYCSAHIRQGILFTLSKLFAHADPGRVR